MICFGAFIRYQMLPAKGELSDRGGNWNGNSFLLDYHLQLLLFNYKQLDGTCVFVFKEQLASGMFVSL